MAQASQCDEDERTGERRRRTTRTKTPTGQRKQEKKGGEALPGTKPLENQSSAGEIQEERKSDPHRDNQRPEKQHGRARWWRGEGGATEATIYAYMC